MKKLALLFVFILYLTGISPACTTFFIHHNGQMLFGRNYDWVTENGMICSNLRGLSKTSMKTRDGSTLNWVSKYGSITFNQYGKEFPTGGMNEKGLVVELMWLDGTQYPSPDERPALGVLQWIQYQLDNCALIDEVIATDKLVRIASRGTAPLHYLVADATGHAATIEFFNGKLTVHRGNNLPYAVLTNDTYESSVAAVKVANNSGANAATSFQSNSLERFTRACQLLTQLQQLGSTASLIDYSFNILDRVSQGPATKWSIVYDITNKTIFFRTNSARQIKNINFSDLDFQCGAVAKAMDLNKTSGGNINKTLEIFSLDLNRRIVEKSFEESRSEIQVSVEEIEASWRYAGLPFCPKRKDE